jgi:hypothetical protein
LTIDTLPPGAFNDYSNGGPCPPYVVRVSHSKWAIKEVSTIEDHLDEINVESLVVGRAHHTRLRVVVLETAWIGGCIIVIEDHLDEKSPRLQG